MKVAIDGIHNVINIEILASTANYPNNPFDIDVILRQTLPGGETNGED